MPELENLLKLYIPLIGWVGLGLILGQKLSKEIPSRLGKFLFWVGVPLSILVFMRQANLSTSVWIAPIVCWIAIGLGAGLAWIWIKAITPEQLQNKPTQGSFLLAAMIGNTGYLGYPVTLALAGANFLDGQYFTIH